MFETAVERQAKARRKTVNERPVRMIVLFVLGSLISIAALSNAIGQVAAEESVLVKVRWTNASEPGTIESASHAVRYCQPDWAILETKESELENLRSSGFSFDVIDTMTVGERYWLITPAKSFSTDSLAAYGRLVFLRHDLWLLAVDETLEPRLAPFVSALTLLPERMECGVSSQPGRPPWLGSGVYGLPGTGNAGFLGTVSSTVSMDSIRSTVHFLSFDDDSAKLRSRFTFRPDSLTIPLWLMEKLRIATGGKAAVALDSFVFRYGGLNYTRYNVVGRIPGRVPGSGTFVLCAHYDSQAGSTVYAEPGRRWDWRIDPAPGADDNGSGVASVLECARVLSALEFDVDLEFVFFCAEEQGLFGSQAYVQNRKAQGYNILGALNFDMHAYRTASDSTFLRTNLSSGWLSNHVKMIAETLFDSIGIRVGLVPVEGPYDVSDHASFWMSRFDGVHFFEQAGFPVLNPYYHTVNDTAGTLDYVLAWKVARLGAASVAYFATTSRAWDLEVMPGDLELRLEGHTGLVEAGSVGEVVRLSPSFHNIGAEVPDTISVHVAVYDGDPSSGWLIGERVIYASTTPIPAGGSPVIEPFTWLLTEGDVGAHSIYLVVDGGETEQVRTNNFVSKTFRVGSLSLAIRESCVLPNPSVGPVNDMTLRVFVTRDAYLTEVDLYDISGRRVGGCRSDNCSSAGLVPGDNDIALSSILSGSAVAPGVYLYRLRVDDGVREGVCYGRFAVLK